MAERKQVKEQKEEAERYTAKTTELANVTTESYLYQLYHVKVKGARGQGLGLGLGLGSGVGVRVSDDRELPLPALPCQGDGS